MIDKRTYDEMQEIVLTSKAPSDEITRQISQMFAYDPDEKGVVTRIKMPKFPEDYSIGLIVGSSGSGKTTILNTAFDLRNESVDWDNAKCIASNFDTFEEASEKFGAVGLSSIPTWMKPYNVLSNGEKFRADMAMRLKDEAVIDEFTSVVNREVAISCCVSLEKYIRTKGLKRITFASCHDDIIPYLRPDWIYNTDTHEFYNGRYLQRPKIKIEVHACNVQVWDMFKRHHYLSGDINRLCQCYLGTYNDIPVVFSAVLPMPSGYLQHAFRESRLVVIPDYQGMGIGMSFSEMVAEAYHRAGCRFFSKSANPRAGDHRDKSDLWKPTSKNHKSRMDYLKATHNYNNMLDNAINHANRECYSHEYVGDGKEYPFIYGVRTELEGQISMFE